MLDTVFGLPVHPLIVHATVVVVPVAALAIILATLWPRFRRWAAWGPLALTAAAVILTPLSTQSGEALQRRLPGVDLIEKHQELADGLLPWVIALLAGAAGLYVWHRLSSANGGRRLPRWAVLAIMIVSVVAAIGTIVEVILIGHSGATAAWSAVG